MKFVDDFYLEEENDLHFGR